MARERLIFYSLYPFDFDTDESVRGMDDGEVGLYIRCLNHAWINGGLPSDPEEIDRVIPGRRTPEQFSERWGRVSKCFTTTIDGRLVNSRQEEERGVARSKSTKAKESIAARWGKSKEDAPVDTNDIRKPNERSTNESVSNGERITNRTEQINPVVPSRPVASEALLAAFKDCQEMHPNCTDPDLAFQIFISMVDSGKVTEADAELMVPGMWRWLDSQEWADGNSPEKYSANYKKFSQWISLKSWTGKPKASEAAKVERRGAVRSTDGTDPNAIWIAPWDAGEKGAA